MLVALRLMDPAQLNAPRPVARKGGELRAALRYVRRTPELLIPLAMMVVVGTVSYNFQVLLPLLASFTWHGHGRHVRRADRGDGRSAPWPVRWPRARADGCRPG